MYSPTGHLLGPQETIPANLPLADTRGPPESPSENYECQIKPCLLERAQIKLHHTVHIPLHAETVGAKAQIIPDNENFIEI